MNNALDEGIKAFLEIGNERNNLVHSNYAAYYLEKTTDEVFQLYEKSQTFIEYLNLKLHESVTVI